MSEERGSGLASNVQLWIAVSVGVAVLFLISADLRRIADALERAYPAPEAPK